MNRELVRVVSVYGGSFIIDKSRYDNGHNILHRFNRYGEPIEMDKHGTVGIHRENILRFCGKVTTIDRRIK
jgi:hypothetical protein